MPSTSNKRIFKDEYVFTHDEKCVLLLALEHLQTEIDKFIDKKYEFGDTTISSKDVEQLKEFLKYG